MSNTNEKLLKKFLGCIKNTYPYEPKLVLKSFHNYYSELNINDQLFNKNMLPMYHLAKDYHTNKRDSSLFLIEALGYLSKNHTYLYFLDKARYSLFRAIKLDSMEFNSFFILDYFKSIIYDKIKDNLPELIGSRGIPTFSSIDEFLNTLNIEIQNLYKDVDKNLPIHNQLLMIFLKMEQL